MKTYEVNFVHSPAGIYVWRFTLTDAAPLIIHTDDWWGDEAFLAFADEFLDKGEKVCVKIGDMRAYVEHGCVNWISSV